MHIISDQSDLAVASIDSMSQHDRDEELLKQSEEDAAQISETVLQGWFNDSVPGKKDTLVNPYGFLG